jgi:GNAT superfamily N-acetyltransferase
MRFLASHQDASVTKRRVAAGETIVAVDADSIVGIVTLTEAANTHGSPLYDRPDVAGVHQFAVRPSYQGRGIGSTLLQLAERRARENGVGTVALDTSEQAAYLIAFYESRGYRFVEHVQWQVTNYRSVVLAKPLTDDAAPA